MFLKKLRPDDGLTGGQGNGSFLEGQAQSQGGAAQKSPGTPPAAGTQNTEGSVPGPNNQPQQVSAQAQQQVTAYKPFNTIDGGEPLDAATFEALSQLGLEMKLTQEQMQKFVNYGQKRIGDEMEAIRAQIEGKFIEWENASKNDDEIKPFLNEEGKMPKIFEFVNRAMGNPDDTKKFLSMARETGIGVNPLFIKFCIRAHKLMGESPFLGPSKGGAARPMTLVEQAKSLFPDM